MSMYWNEEHQNTGTPEHRNTPEQRNSLKTLEHGIKIDGVVLFFY